MKKIANLVMGLCACAAFSAAARTVSIGTYVANPGQTVEVPVSLNDAKGLTSVSVKLVYESTIVEFVDAVPGSLEEAFADDFTVNSETLGQVSVGLFAEGNVTNEIGGTVAVVRFKVRENTSGSFSDLTVVDVQISEVSGVKDTTRANPVDTVNGMLRSVSTTADVTRLENAQYLCAGAIVGSLTLSAGDGIVASTNRAAAAVGEILSAYGSDAILIAPPADGWTNGKYWMLQAPVRGLTFSLRGVPESAQCDFSSEEVEGSMLYAVTLSGIEGRVVPGGIERLDPGFEPCPIREEEVEGDRVEPTVFSGVSLTFGEAPMAVGDVVGMYRASDGQLCGYGKAFAHEGGARLTLSVQVTGGTAVYFRGWQQSSGMTTNLLASLDGAVAAQTIVMPAPGSIDSVLVLTTEPDGPVPPPVEPVVTNTITYLNLQGAANPNPVTFTTNDLPLALGPVARTGWRFLGWTPNDGVISAGTVTNVTFTANWEEILPEPCPIHEEDVEKDQVEPTVFAGVSLTFGEAPMAVGDVVGMYRTTDDSLCGYGEVTEDDGVAQLTLCVQVTEGTAVYFRGWQQSSELTMSLLASLDGAVAAQTIVMPAPGSIDSVLVLTTEPDGPVPPPVEPVVTNTITYLNLQGAANPNPVTFTTNDLPLVLGPVEREGYEFLGWAPWGGVIPAGTASNVTFTALWEKEVDPLPEPTPIVAVEDPAPTEADKTPVTPEAVTSALSYSGYLTNDAAEVVGLVTVKVAKKGKVSATVQLQQGTQALKKFSYAGTEPLSESGTAKLACKKNGGTMELSVGEKVVSGTVEQDRAKYGFTGRLATKDVLKSVDRLNGKAWTVALYAPTNDIPHPLMNGYSYLTVTAAKKGKVKVAGLLADGTKISVTAQGMVFDADCVVVPVNAALYKGKAGGFSLKLQIQGDELTVGNVSKWTAVIDKTYSVKWGGYYVSVREKSVLADGTPFYLASEIPLEKVVAEAADGTPTLPDGVAIGVEAAKKGKWILPKSGKVALKKGAQSVTDLDVDKFKAKNETEPNPAGLKLTYTAKTGTFKGSFALYQDVTTTKPKLKKLTAKVNGVVVDGVGYGSAVIKRVGSISVVIAPCGECQP